MVTGSANLAIIQNDECPHEWVSGRCRESVTWKGLQSGRRPSLRSLMASHKVAQPPAEQVGAATVGSANPLGGYRLMSKFRHITFVPGRTAFPSQGGQHVQVQSDLFVVIRSTHESRE